MFRTILFWLHLSAGSLAGVVIVVMSVTGVMLAWQRQITQFADRRSIAPVSAQQPRTSPE